jgi:hypothetical protein
MTPRQRRVHALVAPALFALSAAAVVLLWLLRSGGAA